MTLTMTHTRTHIYHTHTQSEPSETNFEAHFVYVYYWVCEAQKIDVCSVLKMGAGKMKISFRIFLFFRASRPQNGRQKRKAQTVRGAKILPGYSRNEEL